jgi:hypothetical protein
MVDVDAVEDAVRDTTSPPETAYGFPTGERVTGVHTNTQGAGRVSAERAANGNELSTFTSGTPLMVAGSIAGVAFAKRYVF